MGFFQCKGQHIIHQVKRARANMHYLEQIHKNINRKASYLWNSPEQNKA